MRERNASMLPGLDCGGSVGSSIHMLREAEREARGAYRVQRLSLAARAVYLDRDEGWIDIQHRRTEAGAVEHATHCLQSYRTAALTIYTHVRVINAMGETIWKEKI